MITNYDDLERLSNRAPHYSFLMSLFGDWEHRDHWDACRQARFLRVKELLLNCWQRVEAMARQMAGNDLFDSLYAALRRAVKMLEMVEKELHSLPERLQMRVWLATWDPTSEGQPVC